LLRRLFGGLLTKDLSTVRTYVGFLEVRLFETEVCKIVYQMLNKLDCYKAH